MSNDDPVFNVKEIFIGGIAAGQWISVPNNADRWRARAKLKPMAPVSSKDMSAISQVEEAQTYRRTKICFGSPDNFVEYFVPEEWSDRKAFAHLINNYNPRG